MKVITVIATLGTLLVSIIVSTPAKSQENQKNAVPQETRLIESMDGPALFRAYCATCHGKDAKGHGPALSALKKTPPDLTRLSIMNGGMFPLARVEATIAGDDPATPAHGSRDMPIWGPIFGQIGWDRDFGKVRIHNLAKYIESMQGK
jgi:mono/diheme cytochrome c family protein